MELKYIKCGGNSELNMQLEIRAMQSLSSEVRLHNAINLKVIHTMPWLVQLSGLSASLRNKGLLVRFPVRAHAWVLGQVPPGGGAH